MVKTTQKTLGIKGSYLERQKEQCGAGAALLSYNYSDAGGFENSQEKISASPCLARAPRRATQRWWRRGGGGGGMAAR